MGTSLGAMQGQEKCQLGRKYAGGIQPRLGGTGSSHCELGEGVGEREGQVKRIVLSF